MILSIIKVLDGGILVNIIFYFLRDYLAHSGYFENQIRFKPRA